jgi:hypothetical protein
MIYIQLRDFALRMACLFDWKVLFLAFFAIVPFPMIYASYRIGFQPGYLLFGFLCFLSIFMIYDLYGLILRRIDRCPNTYKVISLKTEGVRYLEVSSATHMKEECRMALAIAKAQSVDVRFGPHDLVVATKNDNVDALVQMYKEVYNREFAEFNLWYGSPKWAE